MSLAKESDARKRLNPFFIRSIVQYGLIGSVRIEVSLNPFFIRSIVQYKERLLTPDEEVLIPSSSGQSFNNETRGGGAEFRLNPFFIRSIVQCDG